MSRTFRFPIEFGQVLAFRRALGYPDGAALSGGHNEIVAPATFVAAGAHFDPESRLRPRPGIPWVTRPRTGSRDASRRESNARLLHAEQHYEYHGALRPGMVLTADTRDGATWVKDGRGGPMTFTEILTEYRDEGGELIVTSRSVRVELPGAAAT